MKERYISPELHLLSFVPAARIASSDDILGDASSVVSSVIVDTGDIDLDL